MVRRRTGAAPRVCYRRPGGEGGGGGNKSDGFDGDGDGYGKGDEGDAEPVVVGDGGGDSCVKAPICPILSIGGFSKVQPSQTET